MVNHFETDFIHLYTLSWSAYKKADGELALGGKKEATPAATFVVVHAGGTAGLPAPPVLSMSRAALSTKRIAAGAAISDMDMDSQRGPAACPSPFCSAGKPGDTSPLRELQPAHLLQAAQERRARDTLK